jgi:hypothetical protein
MSPPRLKLPSAPSRVKALSLPSQAGKSDLRGNLVRSDHGAALRGLTGASAADGGHEEHVCSFVLEKN